MAIKLAVFDMAGTTVADESAVATAFSKAFSNQQLTVSEDEVKPLMGYKKTSAIQTVLERMGVEWDEELLQTIHEDFVSEMLDHYEYSPSVRPMAGAEAIFLELKEKGIRIALNTGFPKQIADVILQRLQWKDRGLVDDCIASDEVLQGRPQPFMIKELMKRAGVNEANEVAKIGDTEVDIKEGRNAGCALVVAVTTGAFTREQLEHYQPDYIVDNLSEVSSLILYRD